MQDPADQPLPPDAPATPAAPEAPDAPAPIAAPEAADAVATPADPAAPADSAVSAASADAAAPTLAQTGAALAERFPALFTPGAPRPIKLRIQADIQERAPGAFTRKQLSIFLHRHTTSTAYLKALVDASQRFDLDGAAAGEVAAEHRDAAGAELERRRLVVELRRAAEREARRARAPARTPARTPNRPTPDDQTAQGPQPEHARQHERSRKGERPPTHGRDRPRDGSPGAPQPAGRPPRPTSAPHRPVGALPPQQAAAPGRRAPLAPPAPGLDPSVPGAAAAPLPDDPARRERALLLRAWESSPLTPANFCALKGLKVADFEAALALARQERGERGKPAEAAAPTRGG